MLNYPSHCLAAQSVFHSLSPRRTQSYEFNDIEREPTVLIVDDDPGVAPLVKCALRPFDIHAEAVVEGVAALRHMRTRRYDLIVLDLAMGDVHGFDVLRALREMPLNKHVPVLILTANGSHEAMARSFGHGADEFVKKPFDLRELGMRAFRLIYPFGQ